MHKSLTVKAFNILAFYPTKQKFTKNSSPLTARTTFRDG